MNVVVTVAVAPLPPHVAFTTYVPAIQLLVPPATVTPLYSPVTVLTPSFSMSTVVLAGLVIVTMTAVGIVGAGVTDPLIIICAAPE